jgi:hypothetical protein
VGVEDPSVLPSSSEEVPVIDETKNGMDDDTDDARTDQEVRVINVLFPSVVLSIGYGRRVEASRAPRSGLEI